MGDRAEKAVDEAGLAAFIDPGTTALLGATREAAIREDKYTPASKKKKKAEEEQEAAIAAESARIATAAQKEEERRRRQSIFQTGGTSGQEVGMVGSRGTLFGN